jgi:hypothetical protein
LAAKSATGRRLLTLSEDGVETVTSGSARQTMRKPPLRWRLFAALGLNLVLWAVLVVLGWTWAAHQFSPPT